MIESQELKNMRQTLYEDAWSLPMTALGKKYGLSDNGVRKRCRSLNIPMPPFGYWAKLKAGKPTVERPPLPEYNPTILDFEPGSPDVDIPVRTKPGSLVLLDLELLSVEQLSSMKDLDLLSAESKQTFLDWCKSITVPGRMTDYDMLISKHKAEIEYREVRDKECPYRDGPVRICYPQDKVKIRNNESVLPITVSTTQRNRAYRIVDTIFRAFRTLKARISVNAHSNGQDNVYIALLDSSISFEIHELMMKRRHLADTPNSQTFRPLYEEVYDGRIRIVWKVDKFSSYYDRNKNSSCSISFEDSQDISLESQIPKMLIGLYEFCCDNVIQRALENKKYEMQAEQEQIERLAKEQAEEKQKKEEKRLARKAEIIKSIPQQASDWFKYEQIARYADQLEKYISSCEDMDKTRLLKRYVELVRTNADKCNPTNVILIAMKELESSES